MKNNLIVLDVETGGLDPTKSPITQVALQVLEPVKLDPTFDFDTFVQPYNNLTIDKKALESSRVSMAQVKTGVTSLELIKYLTTIFKSANKSGKDQTKPILVGHNIGFDFQFLEYLFNFHNKNLYDFIQRIAQDTIWLCRLYEMSLKSDENSKFTLAACCDRLGIELHGAHGAPADVEATRLLFTKLIKLLRNADTTPDRGTSNTTTRRDIREGYYFEF